MQKSDKIIKITIGGQQLGHNSAATSILWQEYCDTLYGELCNYYLLPIPFSLSLSIYP